MKYSGWKVIAVNNNNITLKHKTGLKVSVNNLSQQELDNKDILKSKIKDSIKRAEEANLISVSNELATKAMNFRLPWWRKLVNLFK